jgi:phenylpropionate dioxygenase-like ring-hydroxylating dioxygenase large terminal subunit
MRLFTGFAHVWTAVLPSAQLRNAPLPLRLAGTDLVLFRAGGTVRALLDRCPHRGARLSLGTVGNGCIQCPFHGWRFDGEGRNVHVPLNPDAKLENLGAVPVPVREIGGLLWIYTAPGRKAPVEPHVPDTFTRDDVTRTHLVAEWNAHWTRAMENMLDSPHVPFVHRTTIGRASARVMTDGSLMDVTWEETPYGGRTTSSLDGGRQGAELDFYKPNTMVLHIPIPNRTFRIHAVAVPIDDARVRMIIVGARSFQRARIFNPIFNRVNAKIAEQDRPIVESQQPAEVPESSTERSVRTDRATLQFRKYYFTSLRGSSASV